MKNKGLEYELMVLKTLGEELKRSWKFEKFKISHRKKFEVNSGNTY